MQHTALTHSLSLAMWAASKFSASHFPALEDGAIGQFKPAEHWVFSAQQALCM